LAESRLLSSVEAVYEKYRVHEAQHQRVSEDLFVQLAALKPQSHLRLTAAGLEMIIRFPVPLDKASSIDDEVTRALLDAIEREPKLRLADRRFPRSARPEINPPRRTSSSRTVRRTDGDCSIAFRPMDAEPTSPVDIPGTMSARPIRSICIEQRRPCCGRAVLRFADRRGKANPRDDRAGASLTEILTSCAPRSMINTRHDVDGDADGSDGQRLWPVAAPHVPSDWARHQSLTIGHNIGSCARRPFEKSGHHLGCGHDPLWSDLRDGQSREAALAHGLRADGPAAPFEDDEVLQFGCFTARAGAHRASCS